MKLRILIIFTFLHILTALMSHTGFDSIFLQQKKDVRSINSDV